VEKIKRAQLLFDTEVEELYARPEFDPHEQQLYFELTSAEREALAQNRNIKTRVHFILQLGYFKAKQQFFTFSFNDVGEDVKFILQTYYSDTNLEQFSGSISREYTQSV
jgi:hypothetical protein